MIKPRNQNSIVFLATLGVYLGLVLAGGAAPQVYAHAAMTRHFEILDEIEVKDDRDEKPDDEVSTLSDSLGTYFYDVERFIASLQRLNAAGKFDAARDTFAVGQTTLLPCVKDNRVGSYTADDFATSSESVRPTLEWFSKKLTDGYSLADCLPSARFEHRDATASQFKLKLDGKELAIEVVVKKRSPQIAESLYFGLGKTYASFKPTETRELARLRIYENTSFRFANDQVFVVTRLPRSGLIALLATEAK
ncbi:MAG: hypothetical protein LC730_07020 [Acidobacteria bacterium]|nr:hypothetical protein [Acidobacteriota bacterium]MCA1609189.1 hypothetical protein [Acidobacteriota bacterium]